MRHIWHFDEYICLSCFLSLLLCFSFSDSSLIGLQTCIGYSSRVLPYWRMSPGTKQGAVTYPVPSSSMDVFQNPLLGPLSRTATCYTIRPTSSAQIYHGPTLFVSPKSHRLYSTTAPPGRSKSPSTIARSSHLLQTFDRQVSGVQSYFLDH